MRQEEEKTLAWTFVIMPRHSLSSSLLFYRGGSAVPFDNSTRQLGQFCVSAVVISV